MRRLFLVTCSVLFLAAASSASAATGRVAKVLPHFLDLQGRHTLSPSLFDRDAYQKRLREQPELRSALRFDIHWRSRGVAPDAKMKLRVELRGIARGDLRGTVALEQAGRPATSRWDAVLFEGEAYRAIGEVTAWRVTLWDGDQLLGEQKSFLW